MILFFNLTLRLFQKALQGLLLGSACGELAASRTTRSRAKNEIDHTFLQLRIHPGLYSIRTASTPCRPQQVEILRAGVNLSFCLADTQG